MNLEAKIKELQSVNKKLAKLNLRKEDLTADIINELSHDHEGQQTYEYKEWKIVCKTPCTYSLNKKLYQSGDIFIPDGFNPVKESVSYSIDKKLCEKYMNTGPKDARSALEKLIEIKPSKASVAIKFRNE